MISFKTVLSFLLVHLFFNFGFSQTTEIENNSKIASVITYQDDNSATYEFTPLTDFDEFRTPQRVDRFNSFTGDDIIVTFKNNRIIIIINPSKTKEDNLDKLLLSITRLHGYDSYLIKNDL